MRKEFLTGAIGLAMVLWLAPAASADTVTIGAPSPSPTSTGTCNSCAVMQFASAAGSPSYVVPPAPAGGSWTITSWTSRGGLGDTSAAIEVWRATPNPDQFRLITIGPEQQFLTDTLAAHVVNIPVLPGDRLGVDSGTTNYDPDYGGVLGDTTYLSIGTPAEGQTMGPPGPPSTDFDVIGYSAQRTNVAATLTSTSPAGTTPAPAKKKCKKHKRKRAAESKKKCRKKHRK
jgi:hypothetical protein